MDQIKAPANLSEFASIGSSTAKAVLEQMRVEAREAQEKKQAIEASKSEQVANERQKKIAAVQFVIDEKLAAYEQFRVLAQSALNDAFKASLDLPAGVEPKHPFFFLKKVNLLPSRPRPNDDLFSPFTSTEMYLEGVFAGHAHAQGRARKESAMATVAQIANWLAWNKDAPRHLDAVLSHQTPQVQQQVREAIRDYDWAATGGRIRPFQEPVTTKQVNEHYGFDPKVSARVYQTMEDNSVTTGLQGRLGTDANRPVEAPSLRDHIAAACDVHAPISKE